MGDVLVFDWDAYRERTQVGPVSIDVDGLKSLPKRRASNRNLFLFQLCIMPFFPLSSFAFGSNVFETIS